MLDSTQLCNNFKLLNMTSTCSIVPIERIKNTSASLGKVVMELCKIEPDLYDTILNLCQPIHNKNKIDLEYIYKNLKTDSFINSIRYGSYPIKEFNKNSNSKRIKKIRNNSCFNNSLTITSPNVLGKKTQVKIFSNGNVQIVGLINENEYNTIKCIKDIFSRIEDISYNIIYNVEKFKIVFIIKTLSIGFKINITELGKILKNDYNINSDHSFPYRLKVKTDKICNIELDFLPNGNIIIISNKTLEKNENININNFINEIKSKYYSVLKIYCY